MALGYVHDEEAAERAAAAVRAAGARCVTVRVDTSDEADVDRLFVTAADALGPVTGLVNNAGLTGPLGRLADTDTADLRRVVEVNFLGALLCSRRAAQEMSARGSGVIVNVSSAAATLGARGEVRPLRGDQGRGGCPDGGSRQGTRPGRHPRQHSGTRVIETEIHATMGDPERPRRTAPTVPLRRPGRAEEIAAAIAWLMSPESSYTTGAVLRVSGGR